MQSGNWDAKFKQYRRIFAYSYWLARRISPKEREYSNTAERNTHFNAI